MSKLHTNITGNEDLAKELSELSVSVGCRAQVCINSTNLVGRKMRLSHSQVCDLLGLSLPASRVDKDADEMVVSTKRDLQCHDHFRDKVSKARGLPIATILAEKNYIFTNNCSNT